MRKRSRKEGIDKEVGLEKEELAGRHKGLAGKQQQEGCCVWRRWTFATKEETGMQDLKCFWYQKEGSSRYPPSTKLRELELFLEWKPRRNLRYESSSCE